jgi:hypothetical protein
MQSTINHLESIISKAGEVAETKVELWKLKAAGRLSETVSSMVSKIAVVVLLAIAVIILSLGVAYWLGSALGNVYYGFFIVGGFYALAGLLIFVFRDQIIKGPVSNLIIDKITGD